jgi:hypothetical protein
VGGGFAGRTFGYPQIRATRETGCARHGAEQPMSAWKSHAAAETPWQRRYVVRFITA